jgi:hypothetical protein
MLCEKRKVIIDIYPFRVNGISFKAYYNLNIGIRSREKGQYRKNRDKEKVIPNIGRYDISEETINQFKNVSIKQKVGKRRNEKVEKIRECKKTKSRNRIKMVYSNLSLR